MHQTTSVHIVYVMYIVGLFQYLSLFVRTQRIYITPTSFKNAVFLLCFRFYNNVFKTEVPFIPKRVTATYLDFVLKKPLPFPSDTKIVYISRNKTTYRISLKTFNANYMKISNNLCRVKCHLSFLRCMKHHI